MLNVSDVLRAKLYAAFPPAWHLHFSTQFIYDFLLGLVVAANFASVANIGGRFTFIFLARKPIRFLSEHTFSAYVFHMPLAALAWNGLGLTSAWTVYSFIATGVFLLAQITERRTRFYRGLLKRLLPRLAS